MDFFFFLHNNFSATIFFFFSYDFMNMHIVPRCHKRIMKFYFVCNDIIMRFIVVLRDSKNIKKNVQIFIFFYHIIKVLEFSWLLLQSFRINLWKNILLFFGNLSIIPYFHHSIELLMIWILCRFVLKYMLHNLNHSRESILGQNITQKKINQFQLK